MTVRRVGWRRWLLVVLAVVVLAIVAAQFTSAAALGTELARASWGWALVALALQAAFFVLYGGLYQAGFRAVGVSSGALRLVPVLFASIFAKPPSRSPPPPPRPCSSTTRRRGAVRATGGDRGRRRPGRGLLTALPFVFAGTAALIMRDRLVEFGLAGTGLFVAFTGGVVAVLWLAARRPGWLEALLAACRAAVNGSARRLGHRDLLPAGWERRTTDQMAGAANSIPSHPRDMALAACYGLLVHLANIAGLGAIFLAFGQPLDVAALAAGFGMSIVFFIIAIVPDGVGAVEGAMAVVFVQLGMATPAAILVTVAFRILNVWLPVAIGLWCARRLRLFGAPRRRASREASRRASREASRRASREASRRAGAGDRARTAAGHRRAERDIAARRGRGVSGRSYHWHRDRPRRLRRRLPPLRTG